jgi:hypothetical protein
VALAMADERTLLVPVTVNEQRAYMMLDMAHGQSQITRSSAMAFNLPLDRDGRGITVGDRALVGFVTVKSLVVGNVHFGTSTIQVPDESLTSERSYSGLPVIGTMGLDVFANVDLELNFATSTMTLYSQDHCGGQVVYWSPKHSVVAMQRATFGNLYFPMELNGRKLKTTLTTTSANSMLAIDAYEALYASETSGAMPAPSSADCAPCSPPLTMALTTGGLKVVNAEISLVRLRGAVGRFIPPRQGGAGGYEVERSSAFPLYLGLNVLRQLHFYLATREHRLYFTPALPAVTRDP